MVYQLHEFQKALLQPVSSWARGGPHQKHLLMPLILR